MDKYQKRVIKEKADMDAKIRKLEVYLEKGEGISFSYEAQRLEKQLKIMHAYSNILNERIIHFK